MAIAATPSLQWTMQLSQTKFHMEKVTLITNTFHSLFSGITKFLFSLLKILKLSPMKDDISDNPFLLDPVMQRLVIATQLGRTSVEKYSYEKDQFSQNDIIILPILILFAPLINKKS